MAYVIHEITMLLTLELIQKRLLLARADIKAVVAGARLYYASTSGRIEDHGRPGEL